MSTEYRKFSPASPDGRGQSPVILGKPDIQQQKPARGIKGSTVTIDSRRHAIIFGETLEPDQKLEYKIRPFTFRGEQGAKADGCVFEIQPHGSTTVMRIVDETVKIQEVAIKGKGWFLGINPDGEINVQEVGEHLEENPTVELKNGCIGVWIARDETMEVLDITEPHFQPTMEVEVTRKDLPSLFWQTFDRLKALKSN